MTVQQMMEPSEKALSEFVPEEEQNSVECEEVLREDSHI